LIQNSLTPGVAPGVNISGLCHAWHVIGTDFAWRQSLRISIPSPWLEAQPEAGNEKNEKKCRGQALPVPNGIPGIPRSRRHAGSEYFEALPRLAFNWNRFIQEMETDTREMGTSGNVAGFPYSILDLVT